MDVEDEKLDEELLKFMKETQNMASLIFSLQAYQFETKSQKFNEIFLQNNIPQQEIVVFHYMSPLEKNIILNQIFTYFIIENLQENYEWEAYFLNNSNNFSFDQIFRDLREIIVQNFSDNVLGNYINKIKNIVGFTPEDQIINLKALHQHLNKSNTGRLLIIDSISYLQKKYRKEEPKTISSKNKKQQYQTIKEKSSNYDKEIESQFWESLNQIKTQHKIAIIVFSLQGSYKETIKKNTDKQSYCVSERVRAALTYQPSFLYVKYQDQNNQQLLLIPLNFVDSAIYKQVLEKLIKLRQLSERYNKIRPNNIFILLRYTKQQTSLEFYTLSFEKNDIIIYDQGLIEVSSN